MKVTRLADNYAADKFTKVEPQALRAAFQEIARDGYIAGYLKADDQLESNRLLKMFRVLHGVEPTEAHHPVGAYYPVGQFDGDCSCGHGTWPCKELKQYDATD